MIEAIYFGNYQAYKVYLATKKLSMKKHVFTSDPVKAVAGKDYKIFFVGKVSPDNAAVAKLTELGHSINYV